MAGYTYVASSWRNELYPPVIQRLRSEGLAHYDFRNPEGGTGFSWSEIDPAWQSWTAQQYVAALATDVAERGYRSDFQAMQRADSFVLVLPCGRSAHLELGWAAGQGKRTAILTRDGEEPELMAKMCGLITDDLDEIVRWLRRPAGPTRPVAAPEWRGLTVARGTCSTCGEAISLRSASPAGWVHNFSGLRSCLPVEGDDHG